ncbi:MAG: hypothetical protein IPK60_18930 [Sandaracinaceae bacterium]|nr:hypothetical protein [Sandaracinaceae bacterium]
MNVPTKINVGRVLAGGCFAGVVLFSLAGVLNGAVLDDDFQAWSRAMGALIHPQSPATSMVLWALMSFITGIAGVWIYAAIRPRFLAGPKTALVAAVLVWVVSKLTVALDLFALGVLPSKIVIAQLVGSLVSTALALLAGAALYKE